MIWLQSSGAVADQPRDHRDARLGDSPDAKAIVIEHARAVIGRQSAAAAATAAVTWLLGRALAALVPGAQVIPGDVGRSVGSGSCPWIALTARSRTGRHDCSEPLRAWLKRRGERR
jgi:hypothetical protein